VQFQGAQEACNQADDNCNGQVDEGLTPPAICLTAGACAGTVATCTAAGWDCVYGGTVTTDAAGDVVPENRCDNIDNDCDGRVDEGHPLKGQACGDSGVGVCQGRGTYVCDPGDPTGAGHLQHHHARRHGVGRAVRQPRQQLQRRHRRQRRPRTGCRSAAAARS
jgi:hypothetical protein